MSITQFFRDTLGASLKNSRWSWGAFEQASKCVFVRVWGDEIRSPGGREQVLVYRKNPMVHSAGDAERLEHLHAIENGAQGLGVICRAQNPRTDGVRRIADFRRDVLLLLGDLVEDDSGKYTYITARIPVTEFARTRTGHSPLTEDLQAIMTRSAVDSTSRHALVDARVGQGAFRADVLRLWYNRCAVTGSTILDAIRASHIKPWRDSTDEERLDPMNGLPLVASLDALFDTGLLSFEDSGGMLVSSELSEREREIYGLIGQRLTRTPPAKTAAYLRYHRSRFFRE
jgi:putative restriction endonuclease